ncbi:MAG: hypothetical protein M1832_003791 [Thelocarpon impressellum]|nr:MAG: hypothetical protein M1832_003791 [Thelocarpon impressellum]
MFFRSTLLWAIVAVSSAVTLAQTASDKTGFTGTLSALDGGLKGTVTVQDAKTLLIKNYQLADAGAPTLYWWGSTTENLRSGFRISEKRVSEPSDGKDLQIPLDSGKTVADFSTVGLWCERFGVNYGQATLKASDGSNVPAASGASSTASAGSTKTNGAVRRSDSLLTKLAAVMGVLVTLLVVGS